MAASATRDSKETCDLKDKVRAGSKRAVLLLCNGLKPGSLTALIESLYPGGDMPIERFDLIADGYATWVVGDTAGK